MMSLILTHILQVTVVVLLVAGVIRLGCRNRPHLAHALWMLVFIKCLTPPIMSYPTSIFSWLGATKPFSTAKLEGASEGKDREHLAALVPMKDAHPENLDSPSRSGVVASQEVSSTTDLFETVPLLAIVWAAGALLLVVLIRRRRKLGLRAIRNSSLSPDPHLVRLVEDISRRVGLSRPPHFSYIDAPYGPMAHGVFRPTIVIPKRATRQDESGLEAILAHELTHIRRGDPLVCTFQIIAQVVFWFHPLIWWAGRLATRERERCCDEETVSNLGCPRSQYAQALINVLKLRQTLNPVVALPGVRPVEVTAKRLEHVMNPQNLLHRRSPLTCQLALLIGALLLCPAQGLVLGASDPPPSLEEVSVVSNGSLIQVSLETGGKTPVGKPGDWRKTDHAVGCGEMIYSTEGRDLYATDPQTGRWQRLGEREFAGTRFLISAADQLFMIDDQGNLYHVSRENGNLEQKGPDGGWTKTDHVVGVKDRIYSVEGAILYETNPQEGTWRKLGSPAFEQTSFMVSVQDRLYTIESDGNLYHINTDNGEWQRLGPKGGWISTDHAVGVGERIYSTEQSVLYETDPKKGDWRRLGNNDFQETGFLLSVGTKLTLITKENASDDDRGVLLEIYQRLVDPDPITSPTPRKEIR